MRLSKRSRERNARWVYAENFWAASATVAASSQADIILLSPSHGLLGLADKLTVVRIVGNLWMRNDHATQTARASWGIDVARETGGTVQQKSLSSLPDIASHDWLHLNVGHELPAAVATYAPSGVMRFDVDIRVGRRIQLTTEQLNLHFREHAGNTGFAYGGALRLYILQE